MNKLVCVFGAILAVKAPNTGVVVVNPLTSELSDKMKTNGKPVYKKIGFSITGATDGVCAGAVGVGVINGNSVKNLDDGDKIVLENAEKTMTVEGAGPCTFSLTVVISSPGQTKVKEI